MTDPKKISITVGGHGLKFLRSGSGVPVFFLHGAAGANWTAFHDHVAQSFEVWLPEHPGFGTSPAIPGVETIADLARFYEKVFGVVGLDGPHIVGNSLGGWLASELTILAEGRVASLSLMAPIGMHPRPPGSQASSSSREDALRRLYFDQSLADRVLSSQPSGVELQRQANNRDAAGRYTTPTSDPSLAERLEGITVPAFVLWGADDRVAPASNAKDWGERLHTTPTLLEKCGQLPHIERAEAAQQWLRSNLVA